MELPTQYLDEKVKQLGRKIKIFGTPWHIAHQYSLMTALAPWCEFYFLINNIRKWGIYRPTPSNLFFVPYYEPGKYDFALLHLDQQCVDFTLGKSKLYRELNSIIKDIPKIVINHGTPFWPECFEADYIKSAVGVMIGDNHMVVNSHRAKEMWGNMGKTSRAIIHGIEDEGWQDLPKEPRVITSLSPAGLDTYYNRRLLTAVKEKLAERGIPHVWITVDWVADDFADYQQFIGRSLIYLNPTLESPMPRARTEAMLSGCLIMTLPGQDAESFIENGKTGFLIKNNPDAIADMIQEIMENHYTEAVKIGQAGKLKAQETFKKSRYAGDWANLIKDVLN